MENDADEKIRPSFSIELRDGAGRLRGGTYGAVHELGGKRFAYLAAMTLDVGLPPSTGIAFGKALLDFLRSLGVSYVHLGTTDHYRPLPDFHSSQFPSTSDSCSS